MPSATTWTRLEARARSGDMRPSLEARVHDPLWLLGRQWQLGEFRGEDAGSPVSVRARGDAAPITTFRPGDGAPAAYEPGTPLEALVEREPPGPPDRRLAAEGGAHLLRRLGAAGLARHAAAFVAAYPLTVPPDVDAASRRYLALMAGRVPDGAAFRAEFTGDALPATPAIPAADRADVLAAATAWRAWFDGLAGKPGDAAAWRRDRMEYRFALASPAGVTLTAEEYTGGRLDWTSFDAGAGLAAAAGTAETIVQTTLPAPVRYAGMPAARWWQFEDARVDFGGIETAPEDLARMLVTEFASLYGNDWYLMPIDLPIGSLTRISTLVVTDAFGERTLIAAAPATGGWSLFRLSAGGTARHERLLLAPTVAASLEGDPLEEVLLLRDELANMAWAVERRVETATGGSRERAEEQAEEPSAGPGDGWQPAAELAYELMSRVPAHWIPLLPEEVAPGAMRLRRGAMERLREGALESVPPAGRLLEPGRELVLHEEEVPRAGARVTRARQYARWTDGSAHLWTGRRKQPGRGEGSSGLRFDAVVPAEPIPVAYDAEAVEQRWYADPLGRRRLEAHALGPGARAWCVLRVANRGAATWRRGRVALGVLLPRGGPSPLATAEWPSAGVAATLVEPEVPGGATGTFAFPVVLPLDPGPFAETVNLFAGGRPFPPGAATELRGTVAAAPVPEGWQPFFTQVTDDRAVALTRADGRLVVFKRHWDGSLRVKRDGEWESLGGRTVRIGAALDGAGRAWLFSRDNDEAVRYRAESAPDGPFGDWAALPGPIAGAPAPVREVDGTMTVFATGADGQLRVSRRTAEGFTPWRIVGGDRLGPPAAARHADGRLEVVALGHDGVLRGTRQLTPGGDLGEWSGLGGSGAGTPALVLGHDGRMLAFVTGPDGKLRCRRGGAWEELGGTGLSMPVAARDADGRVEVFARSPAGVAAWRQRVPGGSFEALGSLGGPAGDPAVVLAGDGRLTLLVRGPDGALLARRQVAAGDWTRRPDTPSLAGVQLARHATLGADTLLRPRPRPVREED